jgi:hypothetical protein
MEGESLGTCQMFMNTIDALCGLCRHHLMQIKEKHELSVSVAGQPQQHRVQVSQGKAKKGCSFNGGANRSKKNVRNYG